MYSRIGEVYSGAMTLDNTHVSKVAGFILMSLGLFQVFLAENWEEGKTSKEKINILGWVTFAVGAIYMLFTLVAGMRLLS